MPMFSASALPPFSLHTSVTGTFHSRVSYTDLSCLQGTRRCMGRLTLNMLKRSRTISAVSSVEPSSTTIISYSR